MKQRKSLIEKLKQVYIKHPQGLKIVFLIFFAISGYLFSSNLLARQISANEFEIYEQVARDVYNHGNSIIYEVPDGISLKISSTSISVSSNSKLTCGKVIAKLKDGELLVTRNTEISKAFSTNFLCMILFMMLGALIVIKIDEKCKKSLP